MLIGMAHVAVCVPDLEAAVAWYRDTLGMRVLSPPYRIEGDAVERDMGELLPRPVLAAAIVGTQRDDHVIELIEYPGTDGRTAASPPVLTDHGITHVGLVCDDVVTTRAELEERGVQFMTAAVADLRPEMGLRTTWFTDPWGTVFILMDKRSPNRPYWRQGAELPTVEA